MKVNAAQHVSGVLTSKESPRGQAGYQTLFYTRELLAQEEIRSIERQAQYSFAPESKAKWQSYRLTSQRHVISRIVPISEPDEFGRRGRFFTHSLICDAPGVQQFEEALLDLLQPQDFFSSLDKVLASDGLKTGYIPTVSIDAKKKWGKEAQSLLREWPGEQLNKLYMLMNDPHQLTGRGQHVALIGNETQILEALKVAFLLTPATARNFCSFDTNASGNGTESGVNFWGRGLLAAGAACYVIDAARREVTIPESPMLMAGGFSLEQVSAPLCKAILARLNQPSEHMLHCLVNRKWAAFIGEPVYHALLHETNLPLTATDLELLTPFGQTHRKLSLLLALKSGNEAQRLQVLATMDAQSYKECVRELRTRPDFKPWQVFSPDFIPTWFALFGSEYGMDDLTTAITQVAEHGSARDRKYVETIHERLDHSQRQALGLWLKASPHHFDALQAALDKPINTKPSSNSAGKFNSLIRRILPFGK